MNKTFRVTVETQQLTLFWFAPQVTLLGNPHPLSWSPIQPGGGVVVLLPELPASPAQAWTLKLDGVQWAELWVSGWLHVSKEFCFSYPVPVMFGGSWGNSHYGWGIFKLGSNFLQNQIILLSTPVIFFFKWIIFSLWAALLMAAVCFEMKVGTSCGTLCWPLSETPSSLFFLRRNTFF